MYNPIGNKCIMCGSYAINPSTHGRKESIDLDLCDVCYWRKRADIDFETECISKREDLETE